MTLFWISVAGLMALTVVFIVPPFFRKQESRHMSEDELNLAVIKQQLEELKADLESGDLDQDQYDAARHDLEKELLADLSGGGSSEPTQKGNPKAGRWAIPLLVVAVPAISLPMYFAVGTPQIITLLDMPGARQAASDSGQGHTGGGQQAGSMVEMIDKLAKKLEQDPNNPDGWKMLGRSYMATNRPQEALKAYEKAYALVPEDPELLLTYAAALAQTNNNLFTGRPTELLDKAIALTPNDPNTQWLRGIAYFQAADYVNAAALWEKVLAQVPPGSQEAESVNQYLQQARARLPEGTAVAPVAQAAPAVAQQQDVGTKASAGGRIRVEVSLDPALRDKVEGSDRVFIFARAVSGPRMPLAAVRRQVKDLPLTLELDDSMAMTPQFVLSRFPEVVVGARISKTGNATPTSGDLRGEVKPVKPGQEETIRVVINTVQP